MALQKQNVSIVFQQGIDTKTDPNQVIAGKLLELENVVFTTAMEFNKSAGYQKLADIDTGINVATFKNELVAFDGSTLQSYSPSTETLINKGNIVSVDLGTSPIYRAASGQTQEDSAFNSLGVYLYVWQDSVNGPQYIVVSSSTGNQLITATNLVSTAVKVKAWALGVYLIITYIDTATNHLRYITINCNTLAVGSPTDLSTVVNASNRFYDGVVLGNKLFLSFNGSDGGGAIRSTTLDRFLNQGPTNVQGGESVTNCIGVFADITLNQVWVAYFNGTNIRYFVLNSGVSAVLAPTNAVLGVSNILNINGYASNGSGKLFYQTQNTYSYSSTRTDFVSYVTATNAGVVGTATVFLRSVGLISKTFIYNSINYFVVAYTSSLQPTYFVVDQNAHLIAKIAYLNGGGYAATGFLNNVNAISTTQFEFAYLFKDLLTTQSGTVYTQTGVNSATINFQAQDLYETVDLGNNLNINGGFLWAYDGYGPVEQNFHIYPEDLGYTSSSASTGLFAGTHNYIALYEWTDNQGNIFKSGYGNPLVVTNAFATSGITVNIPTLRLTAKQNTRSLVSITLYRDAPTVQTGIFYKVSSITSPKLNDVTIDSVQITDGSQDAAIIGNELLYTTGGVVQNTGGQAGVSVANYNSRLIIVSAENRSGFFYSKLVLQGVPVEMAEEFFQNVDPRFGDLQAAAIMDDKLVLFRENNLTYVTGLGPDAAGNNNDYRETFITAPVGSSNPNSIIFTPEGLMFQSNKGIWLLGRSLESVYIGADVEAYNSYTITSARLIPNSTQVRFTLNSGIALVYDYYYKQWNVFTNVDAAGSTIFGDLFTYITPSGTILQEEPGNYTINGQPIFMSLKTGWLSMAGFQGFQRAYGAYIKAKFKTPHKLYVGIAYDFNPSIVQSAIISPTDLVNTNYGNDPVYGSTQYYGGNDLTEQYLVSFDRQKCQSVQITIQEALDTSNPVYGAGLVLEAIGLLIGTKSSYPRLPPNKSIS